MDQIRAASLTTRTFIRPLDFDLAVFAERAFGLYQNEREYGEVVWRFTPAASAHARGYVFHPRPWQTRSTAHLQSALGRPGFSE